MTSARIQTFHKAYNINLGYFNGKEVYPRSVTERTKALNLYNNNFCLIWKAQGISFNKTIEELKINFKIVDNVISQDNVDTYFRNDYKPKKESQLSNVIVYDLETYNRNKAVQYCFIVSIE